SYNLTLSAASAGFTTFLAGPLQKFPSRKFLLLRRRSSLLAIHGPAPRRRAPARNVAVPALFATIVRSSKGAPRPDALAWDERVVAAGCEAAEEADGGDDAENDGGDDRCGQHDVDEDESGNRQ